MKKHAAFTLIELLAVLLICGLLISLLSHLIANSITWSRSGFEEEVIADQLEQALDFMEHDVRSAVDIDVDYFERVDSRPLSEIRTSYELRLLTKGTSVRWAALATCCGRVRAISARKARRNDHCPTMCFIGGRRTACTVAPTSRWQFISAAMQGC